MKLLNGHTCEIVMVYVVCWQVGDCVRCGVSTGALQSEVEVLKRRLLDRDVAIVQLEAQMAQDRPDHYPQGQVAVLRAQCDHWQDKYDRSALIYAQYSTNIRY